MRKETIKRIVKSLGTVVLSVCIAVTSCHVPAWAAEGDTVKTLIGEAVALSTESVLNEYAANEEYIADYNFLSNCGIEDGLADVLSSGGSLNLEISITVNDFTCTQDAAQLVVYAQASDWTNWKQNQVTLKDETPKTYNVTLSLDGYEQLGNLGFRFVGCDNGTYVDYIINSAVITEAEAEDTDAIAVLVSNGTQKEGVVAANPYGNDYIVDCPFTLPHSLTMDLSGYTELKFQVGVTITDYNADEFVSATGEADDVPSALIYAQDSAYTVWKQVAAPLGETPQTIELEIDLRSLMDTNQFNVLGALGFRITGCNLGSDVSYTINYAKVVGEGSGSGSSLIDLKYDVNGTTKDLAYEETPVGQHGKLSLASVDGYSTPVIVDENGDPYQLRGASSHGLSWFPQFVNEDAFHQFRDEWGMNLVRIAVYAREGEYAYVNGDIAAAYNDEIIQRGVEAATNLGMYVIIDWHVLNYNPNGDLVQAKEFFEKYADLYKDYDNVIFEICNEPTNTPWYDGSGNDIYSYSTAVTQVIRDCGNDAIVVCGTDSYSSKIDEVAVKPLSEAGFENIMYACHFYAASHYADAQQKLLDAIQAGTPVFVTEFGVCTASGDGVYDTENADAWLDICDENNISYACWAISNSEESAAYIFSTCNKTFGWTAEDLTNTGRYLVNRYNDRLAELAEKDAVQDDDQNEEIPPVLPGDAAETGDNSIIFMMMMGIAAIVIIERVYIVQKRKKTGYKL